MYFQYQFPGVQCVKKNYVFHPQNMHELSRVVPDCFLKLNRSNAHKIREVWHAIVEERGDSHVYCAGK